MSTQATRERVRALLRAWCVAGFVIALLLAARARSEPEAAPSPSGTAVEGIAPLDPHGNILATTPTAAPATPTPVPTVWTAPPPRTRTPLPFTPGTAAGVALILLGISFFWAEAQSATHGAFAIAGVLCTLAGLAFLFGYTTLAISMSWSAIGPLLIATIGVMVWTVWKGLQQMNEPTIGDMSEHVGKVVKAHGPLEPDGKVLLEGTFWRAISTRPVKDGARVRILSAEGLTLRVEPVEDGAP